VHLPVLGEFDEELAALLALLRGPLADELLAVDLLVLLVLAPGRQAHHRQQRHTQHHTHGNSPVGERKPRGPITPQPLYRPDYFLSLTRLKVSFFPFESSPSSSSSVSLVIVTVSVISMSMNFMVIVNLFPLSL